MIDKNFSKNQSDLYDRIQKDVNSALASCGKRNAGLVCQNRNLDCRFQRDWFKGSTLKICVVSRMLLELVER